ncbi:MAG: Uncharacterized protein CEO22_386 [Candidatus Berkelbacteria bacterium Gr01-1014_85]|uniref:M23ase beta-sheet core domain-containing protein n=1 Tax=Candidatus Berkelbacteria bacterium Gr01-1014_85 TaxID=2017150 RepID=A0A554JBG4_9BACT|nr:MAG: Uncharacterized protein CEO22_386 [Candidatus Berkelbacteria bacterium Gr01-1014_85]
MTPTAKPHLISKFIIAALILVVLVAGFIIWRLPKRSTVATSYNTETTSDHTTSKSESGTLMIKSLPIQLAAYDASTQKAGDLLFTKAKLGEFDLPFFPYGFEILANSAGPAKKNPQPTFIVPLGTKVLSIVDGVVQQIPQLYSQDYSIMVGQSLNSSTVYETEHVIKPIVKVGDKVKAGQVIAEVSDYDSKNTPGYGLVEIGILEGGNPPQHSCPFSELDPSVKDKISEQLKTLYQDWETYRTNTKLYDETKEPITGCLSLDKIEG